MFWKEQHDWSVYDNHMRSHVKINIPLQANRSISLIAHMKDSPIMHYFELPERTKIIKAYRILNEFSGNFSLKLHCGNVVNMLYLGIQQLTWQWVRLSVMSFDSRHTRAVRVCVVWRCLCGWSLSVCLMLRGQILSENGKLRFLRKRYCARAIILMGPDSLLS